MDTPEKPRSSYWLSRLANIGLLAGLIVLVGYFVYNEFADSSVGRERSGRRSTANDRQGIYSKADSAFDNDDWVSAVEQYERVTEFDPDNMRAWVRLAYSLHQLGDLDRAIAAHMKVCEFSRARSWGLYNLACAYALKDEKQLALDYLFEAVEVGYRSRRSIARDKDLANIVEDPRFKELADRATPVWTRPANRQMDFLIGQWRLRDLLGEPQGTYRITQSENGHLLTFDYDFGDELHGTTVCFHDPSDDRWRYVDVNGNGETTRCSGHYSFGAMKFEGFLVRATGKRQRRRVELTPENNGNIGFVTFIAEERSSRWRRDFEGTLIRIREEDDEGHVDDTASTCGH